MMRQHSFDSANLSERKERRLSNFFLWRKSKGTSEGIKDLASLDNAKQSPGKIEHPNHSKEIDETKEKKSYTNEKDNHKKKGSPKPKRISQITEVKDNEKDEDESIQLTPVESLDPPSEGVYVEDSIPIGITKRKDSEPPPPTTRRWSIFKSDRREAHSDRNGVYDVSTVEVLSFDHHSLEGTPKGVIQTCKKCKATQRTFASRNANTIERSPLPN